MALIRFEGAAIPTPDNTLTLPLRGAPKLQDIVPSADQFSSGVNGYEESQPFAEWAVDTFSTLGLRYQRDAPNDPTRGWFSTLDMSVAGQLSVPLRFAGGPFQPTAGGINYGSSLPYGHVYAQDWSGYIIGNTAATENHLLKFSSGAFTDVIRINGTPNTSMSVNGINTRNPWPWAFTPVTRRAGTSLWLPMAAAGGLIDANQAYAQTIVNAGTQYWSCIVLGDVLFTFRPKTATAPYGITVDVWRPFSPTLTAITSGGTAVSQDIPNEVCMSAPFTHEGVVYFATDRALYAVLWDDDRKRILINQVRTEDRITSNAVSWNGNIYYGVGNQLAVYSTTRATTPPVPLDPNMSLKTPMSNDFTWLYGLRDGLYCCTLASTISKGLVTVDTDFSMMVYKLLPNLAWHSVRFLRRASNDAGIGAASNGAPMVVYDPAGTNNPTYMLLTGTSAINMNVIPLSTGTQNNPEFLPTILRQQEATSRFYVTPLIDGRNPLLPKKLERFEGRIADVSQAYPIRLWHQKDADPYSADTFTTSYGPEMLGTGAWNLALTIDDRLPDLYGYGTGVAYGITVAVLDPLIDFQTIRWAIEIVGDPTGVTFPRFFGMKMRFLELPNKFYVWQLPIQLVVGTNKTRADATPQDAIELMAYHDMLENLVDARPRPVIDAIFPTGKRRKGIISKFEQTLEGFEEQTDLDPREGVSTLTRTLYSISFEEVRPAQANVTTVIG